MKIQMVNWRQTLNEFMSYRMSDNYNCSHFARDVWKHCTGHDFTDLVTSWNCGQLEAAMKSRKHLQEIEKPGPLCLVLFHRPKDPPHLGVMIQGKVLHLTADGARYEPEYNIMLTYKSRKYYLV